METQSQSLQSIMNSMVSRLDSILPHQKDLPEGAHAEWPLIELFIKIDPVLADLFKQYQDAQNQLAGVIKERGPNDPMTDVTRDMADSAKTAVTTRYIELQEDEEFQGSAAETAQRIRIEDAMAMDNNAIKKRQDKDNIYSALSMFLWVALIMDQKREMESLRLAFSRSLKLNAEAA